MLRAVITTAALILALVMPVGVHAQSTETVYYFHADAIGSVRMITDESGQEVARYDYLPFGEEWGSSSYATVTNQVKFAGLERDPETGFDYAMARYYQSQTGRFTRPDDPGYADPSDPQAMHLYAYAYNNPLRFVDPTGHEACEAGSQADFCSGVVIMNYYDAATLRFFWDSLFRPLIFPETPTELAVSVGVAALGSIVTGGAATPAAGARVAALGAGRLLGPGTKLTPKILAQLTGRGWTPKLVQRVIDRAVHTSPAINRATGSQATAYFERSGAHVIRDNVTGEIVQVSNRLNPGAWRPDLSIVNPFVP